MDEDILTQEYRTKGTAFTPAGDPLYEERLEHIANDSGGELTVTYTAPGGKMIASKIVQYDCRATMPGFELIDYVNNDKEGVFWQEDQIVSFQGADQTLLDAPAGPGIFDAGFDNAIKINWEELMSGQKLVFSYLFARDNRFIKLKLQKSGAPETVGPDVSEGTVFFKISANNFILRLFSQPLFVGYDTNSRRLQYYSGPSNLPVFNKRQPVLIRYEFLS
ncbi:MAG: hypothetical protein AAF353_13870 [Pseudomonadota bacterium]